MSDYTGPKAPGPMLDTLRAIATLVHRHDTDPGFDLDAEQVVERIGALVGKSLEPFSLEEVKRSVDGMVELIAEGDFEAAHVKQVRLYERVLGELAMMGSDLCKEALRAREIVRKWE